MADQEAPTTEQQETLSQKAHRYFGSEFVGEVSEAAPLAASVEEINEEVSEEADEVEESQATEDVEETEEVEESDGETESEEQPDYEEYELSQIAQLLGVDEDQLDVNEEGRVVLSGKVDGEPVQANAKDLLANYQMLQAADKRLEEAKTKAKAQTQELAERSEALNTHFATVADLVADAEKVLKEDFDAVDWKKLRNQDPAEFAAKERDFEKRQKRIDEIKQRAGEQYQQYTTLQSEEARKQQEQYLRQEGERLLQALPEWKNAEKAKTEKAQLAEYLMNQGFSKEDVMAASDHRLIVLARKAMLFDNTAAKGNAALKKVAKVPKVTKPGTTKSAAQVNKQKLDRLAQKAEQTGSVEDAFALYKARRSKK